LRYETQVPVVHDDPAPSAHGGSMRSLETRRHRALVPSRAGSNQLETVGKLGPVAKWTVERRPKPGITPSGVHHPLSKLERWAVANMLAMPTRELGHPFALVVLVVAADRSLHEFSVPRRSD